MELQHRISNNIRETKFCTAVYAGVKKKINLRPLLSYWGKISAAADLPSKRAWFPWYNNIPIFCFCGTVSWNCSFTQARCDKNTVHWIISSVKNEKWQQFDISLALACHIVLTKADKLSYQGNVISGNIIHHYKMPHQQLNNVPANTA